MLIVNYVIDTLPMKRQKNEDFDDFLSEIDDRKERKKVENISKQIFVSSQKHRMKKQEGATAAATPTFPHSG